MNTLIEAFIISLIPVVELRGGIPYAIAKGANPLTACVVCVIANFLVVPIVYFFLTYIHSSLMKMAFYNRIFTKYIEAKRDKLEKYMGTSTELIALTLFVGVPLPATGAYTGAMLAWFFKMKKRNSYISIFLGVLMAGIIVTLVTVGAFSGFDFLIKRI